MQCVILAGGLGTRMMPETRTIPKTLLPVAGKPFATYQLTWLAQAGIDSVVYCVGYLGQHIRAYVGDGSHWGLSVQYVDEGDQLRGTSGALRLACDEDALDEDFLVLYGDSWLQVDPAAVLRTARQRAEPALMTVFRNDGQWDGSNVVLADDRVARYQKGLTPSPAQMRWIDYGLLAVRRPVIADRVPPDAPQDLAPLCSALAAEGLLAGLEVFERFYEIGSASGREELEALFATRPPRDGGSPSSPE
jgi:NDP-sugar pyrophosphorylase family protein